MPGVDLGSSRPDGFESGQSGTNATTAVSNVRVAIGGWSKTFATVHTAPAAPKYPDEPNVAGILGVEFFKIATLEIDYRRKKLRIYDPENFRPRENSTSVEIQESLGYPVVSVSLDLTNGRHVQGRLELDTGCNCDAIFFAPFVERNAIRDGWKVLGSAVQPGMHAGNIERLQVGPVLVGQPLVGIPDQADGIFGRSDVDGFVGARVLEQSRVTIDFHAHLAWFDQ